MSAFTLYLVLLCDSAVKLFTFLVVLSVVSMMIGMFVWGEAEAHTDSADAIKIGQRMFLWSALSVGLFATLLCLVPNTNQAAFIVGVTESVNSAVHKYDTPPEVLKMWQKAMGSKSADVEFQKTLPADWTPLIYKDGVYAVPTTREREGAIE